MSLKIQKLALFTAAIVAALPSLALALPQSLTIQGRVTAPDNTPITGSAVVFRVQVLTPDAARCILYDESQTLNLSATAGLFSINLNNGLGTVNAPATYSLERALSNRLSYSVSSAYCASGSGTLSYAPSNTDNRKIRILFRDPATMSSFETIPELDLNPVAWAMEARTVGGFESANLLRIQDAGVPGAAPALTTAQLTDLQSLIAGTSANYMQSGTGSGAGAKLPTFSGNPSTLNPGAIWFDTAAGTVKYSPDGSTVQTFGTSSASGTITSVTAGTGLTGGGSTGGVSLALSPSGVTGAGVAVGSASAVPVITYDTYGRITAATTAAISGTLPSGTNGQFLKSSGGSTWAGAGILMGDLKNGAGTLPLFGTVNCSASQSMYWDSGADQIRCQNISVGNAQISDVAWSKITGVPNFVANAGGTPSLLTDTEANLPTVHVNGRIFIASDTKKIFRDNGTTWDELAPGSGGTLTNVLSGAGISVSGTGATRTVALDNTGKAAGTFYKVTTDADGRVSSGAGALVAADIPDLDWAKITTGKPDLVLNALNTKSFSSGPTSAQPTGQTAGRVFIDTTLQKIQYDNGTTWIDVASNGGTGFSGSLSGEVTGTQSATQVNNINGITRSTISANLNAVTNATDAATASQLVKRDANGDFSGRKITSTEVIVKGSAHTVSLTADPSANYTLKLPDDKAASNGQVLTSDTNGVLSWTTPSSAGSIAVTAPVTNTSGTIGMPSANTSRDGYLTQADWNTFSGKLSSALNSALIWVGNGSNVATPVAPSGDVTMNNAGAFAVNKIKGTNIAAVPSTAGQVLRFDGTDYTPAFTRMADLRSTVTGSSAITGNCTASQTLTWNSGTDSLQCQDISVAASTQISGVLPIANGGTGTNSTSQNFVFAGPSSGAGAPAFRALTAADISGLNTYWTSATGGIAYSAGNVGVGTSAPGGKLEVSSSTGDPAFLVSNLATSAGSNVVTDDRRMLSTTTNRVVSRATTGWLDNTDASRTGYWSMSVASGGGFSETLRVSGPNVGIGTVSPVGKLDVRMATDQHINFVTDANGAFPGYAGIVGLNDANNGYVPMGFKASKFAFSNQVGVGTQPNAGIGLDVLGSVGVRATLPGTTGIPNRTLPAQGLYFSWNDSAGNGESNISNHPGLGGGGIRFNLFDGSGVYSSTPLTIGASGNIGISNFSPGVSLDVGLRTDAIRVPNGTTAQQPGQASMPTAANGMIRYNTSTNALEAYVNSAWTNLATVGGTQSFAGNVSVGGTFTSTGAATFNGGATVAGAALNMSSQSITGVGPNITAAGSLGINATGASSGITLNSGTSGSVNAGSANGTSLSVLSPAASSVNYITVKGAPAGSAPTIGSAGADSNVNILLAPKGTGNTIIGNGALAIGTSTPTAPLHVASSAPVANASEDYNFYSGKTYAIADTNFKQGIRSSVTATHASGTIANMMSVLALPSNSSSGTVTNQYGVWARSDSNTGATTANSYGYYFSDAAGAGTINNQYGLYVGALTRGGTNYAVYTAGSTPSYFGGNVGIGTPSAGSPLQVTTNGNFVNNILFSNPSSGSLAASQLQLTTDTGDLRVGVGSSNSSYALSNAGAGFIATMTNNPLQFGTWNTERMRITGAGNVGVGTTTPTQKLQVAGGTLRISGTGASAPGEINMDDGVTEYSGNSFQIRKDAAAYWAVKSVTAGNDLAMFVDNTLARGLYIKNTTGNIGIGTSNPAFKLDVAGSITTSGAGTSGASLAGQGIVAANGGGGDAFVSWLINGNRWMSGIDAADGAKWKLGYTTGTPAWGTDTRLTVTPAGRLGVGTTNPQASLHVPGNSYITSIVGGESNGSGNFHLDAWSSGANRGIYLNWFNGTGATYIGNGTSGGYGSIVAAAFTTASDRTLKKNIEPISDALERLNKISGVRYNWIDEAKQGKERQVGVIAQDVQKVYPELVLVNKENHKLSVNYAGLVAPVLQAVKELYAKFLDDHAELAKLKTQNEEMSRELASLKALVCADHPHASECVKAKKK